MALTPSAMPDLGFTAPDFTLLEPATGRQVSLADVRGPQGTLVVFACNHCPFVLHIEDCLIEMARQWRESGVGVAAISANDITTHPQDGPDAMARRVKDKNYPFPYLYDETQDTAKIYQAACTPDFFLFDKADVCVYRGQFDAATPGNDIPVSGSSLDLAIQNLLQHQPPLAEQRPSIGCNIKWKSA